MKISLEQNKSSNSSTIPYFVHINITTIAIDFYADFRVPILKRDNGGTAIYIAEICGFQVEGDTPEIIVGSIDKIITGLINMSRLPTYIFIARRSHKMYPVYTFGDKVFATTSGGPLFEHVELAKVREYLSDYMHTVGELGTPGASETLHVRGVHRETLGLVRPIFYLKKRPKDSDENEFWAPVFPSKDGEAIYAYTVNGRREVDIDDGHEVLRLRSQVAQALIADKRLKEDYDLRADRLLPEYWEKVKPNLEVMSSKLVYNGSQFDIYGAGVYLVAVEYRDGEDRYSLYIGKGVDDLRERAAKDLVRRRLTKSVTDVKVVG